MSYLCESTGCTKHDAEGEYCVKHQYERVISAEAQRDELQRNIDGICELYGTLTLIGAVVSMHSERKEVAELRAANATLEQEIKRLREELVYDRMLHNQTAYALNIEIARRESAERGLAEMIKEHSEAMTRLAKYEKVTA